MPGSQKRREDLKAILQKQLDEKLMLVERVHFTQLEGGASLLYNCFQGDKETEI